MVNETKKILNNKNLPVAATCVRLPVFTSHAESVYVEVEKANVSVDELKDTLATGKGMVLEDNIETQTYPTPLEAEGKKEVFAGIVRKDLDTVIAYHLWGVSDHLVNGAVWNTVQIATSLVNEELV